MAKRKDKKKQSLNIEPNITLEEFLAGDELTYLGAVFEPVQATYRVGVGILLEKDGVDVGTAIVVTDAGARRAYHNLTRGFIPDAEPASTEKARTQQ
jgi:hypothetical protein